ncbi:MAG TPA: DUF58 domain-containing protein [Steroidobacteraceae bacterium]|nr:DUF58 domain-containing protein [Steroidobacteraceae bacterium]
MNLRQNALALLAATALLAVAGLWRGGPQHWWALPAGLLLLGLAYERAATAAAAVRVSIEQPRPWHLARAAGVALVFTHGARRALRLLVAPEPPAGIDLPVQLQPLTVPAGIPASLQLPAAATRLGITEWPAQRVRAAGPLGLAWWSLRLAAPCALRVVPETLALPERAPGTTAAGRRDATATGAGPEVLQLRDYRPGDALRAIDWKASARRGVLVGRDFCEQQQLDVIVALDAGRSSRVLCAGLDRLGHYVNAAARLAQHVTLQGDRIGVVVYADRVLGALPPARDAAAVIRVRELLGRTEAQSADSTALHAAARIRSMLHQRSLVILLTAIDEPDCGRQLLACLRLLQPKHLALIAGVSALKPEAIAAQAPRTWLDPYQALAAGLQQRQRARSLRALQAAGAAALIAPPQALEQAIFDGYAQFRRRRRI